MNVKTAPTCQIGIYGLGPMGRSLAQNFAEHGFPTAVFNITPDLTWQLMALPGRPDLSPFYNEPAFVAALKRPRKILIMVKSGDPVDQVLGHLLPMLDPGDIIIEGGNSDFRDTARRLKLANRDGILYVGCGVSGGEEGARFGPSIMPGGNAEAWAELKPLLQAIAARNPKGEPCCEWIGPEGSGHYVKTHHNGIEYGAMQIIGEICWILKSLGLPNAEMAAILDGWNQRHHAFLLEITSRILRAADDDGSPLIDHVLDVAGAKGTGSGTVVSALELGQSVNILAAGVAARMMSANRDRRLRIGAAYRSDVPAYSSPSAGMPEKLGLALDAAIALAYAQGFNTFREASAKYQCWKLDLPKIASIWGGGCIIRARILEDIADAYRNNPGLDTLLVAPAFAARLHAGIPALREVVSGAVLGGIPVPALTAAISNFDSMRIAPLYSAQVIALLRDLFGAHTFERTDRPGTFHRDWSKPE